MEVERILKAEFYYVLKLNEEEIKWFIDKLQNPFDEEDDKEKHYRCLFYSQFKDALLDD